VRPAPFIVGAGRSGTTLLRLMLDAHPDLAIPPETHFILDLEDTRNASRQAARVACDGIVAHRRWADFNLDAEGFRTRVNDASPSQLGEVLRIFYSMYAEQQGKPRWGDKTPLYVLNMPLISQLLPEAHFIHVIRDGRDVALSVRRLSFGPDSIEEAALWWKERIQKGQESGAELPYIEVRFEHLVGDPRRELERICGFIDLDFRPQMLNSHTRAGKRLSELKDLLELGLPAARRRQIHAGVRRPPNPRASERWRTAMTSEERQRFEQIAGDTLRSLGYPLD
jgi:hypothetical protein